MIFIKLLRDYFHWKSYWLRYFVCTRTCSFIKKRLQHRCYLVKFANFLRAPNLKIICDGCFCKCKVDVQKRIQDSQTEAVKKSVFYKKSSQNKRVVKFTVKHLCQSLFFKRKYFLKVNIFRVNTFLFNIAKKCTTLILNVRHINRSLDSFYSQTVLALQTDRQHQLGRKNNLAGHRRPNCSSGKGFFAN